MFCKLTDVQIHNLVVSHINSTVAHVDNAKELTDDEELCREYLQVKYNMQEAIKLLNILLLEHFGVEVEEEDDDL